MPRFGVGARCCPPDVVRNAFRAQTSRKAGGVARLLRTHREWSLRPRTPPPTFVGSSGTPLAKPGSDPLPPGTTVSVGVTQFIARQKPLVVIGILTQ
jgi:hypothetical protein